MLVASFELPAQESVVPVENTTQDHAMFIPKSGLLLTRSGPAARVSRRGFPSFSFSDPIRSALVSGTLSRFRPHAGDSPPGQSEWQWKQVEFDGSGAIEQRGLYLYVPIEMDEQRAMILNASGQSETYVNGEFLFADLHKGAAALRYGTVTRSASPRGRR